MYKLIQFLGGNLVGVQAAVSSKVAILLVYEPLSVLKWCWCKSCCQILCGDSVSVQAAVSS